MKKILLLFCVLCMGLSFNSCIRGSCEESKSLGYAVIDDIYHPVIFADSVALSFGNDRRILHLRLRNIHYPYNKNFRTPRLSLHEKQNVPRGYLDNLFKAGEKVFVASYKITDDEKEYAILSTEPMKSREIRKATKFIRWGPTLFIWFFALFILFGASAGNPYK